MNSDKMMTFNPSRIVTCPLLACLAVTGFNFDAGAADTLFTEVADVIPLESTNRRKWDNALIADLDQDGWNDLLLTEHGKQANIHWNNKGTFSEPVKVVGGDTHGVAAGDYDQDGRIDLLIYPGGGGGKKPRNPISFHVNKDRSIEKGKTYEYFDRSRGRAAKLVDSNQDGVLDLILSGFPLDTQKEIGANQLYTHAGDGDFQMESKLPQAKWMGFRTLVTDFNQDGDTDLIFHGGNNMVALQGGEGHSFSDVSEPLLGALARTTFATSLTEVDFDNDGDFDLFVTRADHSFSESCCHEEEGGPFAYHVFASFVNDVDYQFDLTVEGDFMMENLQMAYPTFDAFIGKEMKPFEFGEDRHGGKDFTLKPADSEGYPEDLTKNGLFIGHLGDGVWRVGGKTKSATSGVVRNVTSAPETTSTKTLPARLFENRDGTFVDVTAEKGIAIKGQTTSAAAADFNNDGWTDLAVIRQGNRITPTRQIVYLNQKGQSFTEAENAGVVSDELGATGGFVERFDYDNDGDIDLIYCNERGRWHLMTNPGSGAEKGNYLTVDIGGSPDGKATAQNAVLTLKAGEMTFKRRVGSTSAVYSHSLDTHLHIGLGDLNKVDEAVVRWSNGEFQSLTIDGVNKTIRAGTQD
ncbi:CRTAC1 family protein [Haloferula sp.]|uniref:CRTAC1 family protein n=1 Tax=Haloferula sp. TaxID=2497595 RepID=UPI00329D98F4